MLTRACVCGLLLALLSPALATPAAAQVLPEQPLRTADGRLVVSAELVAAIGSPDEIAFFNYTDYAHNALRMVRLGTSGVWRPSDWLTLAGEVRTEDLDHADVYAAYARVRPWRSRDFTIEAGRIPPVFGAFGRRAYSTDNPVIGYPLAYQYLTSLRTDAVPATADDLLRMRARGWQSSFPIGDLTPRPGIPLMSAFRWDTGVQARWKHSIVEVAGAVTTGSLSNPRVADDNDGKQLSGRVTLTPAIGLVIGVSGARGAWLARGVQSPDKPQQKAAGADIEYSRDHWILRSELLFSRWELPFALAPSSVRSVSALGTWVEGRYRLTPRIFVSGRVDRLGFSQLRGSNPALSAIPWDAPVKRTEVGAGYYLQRNLVARVTVQSNQRSAGRVTDRSYASAQLSYWF